MRKIKNSFFFLCLFTIIPSSLFAWDLEFSEKPQFVTYKFPDERLPRHPFIRFPQSGIMISSFCIYSSGKYRKGRECKAWKPYDYINSGKLVELIREKGFFSEGDSPRQIASMVCLESKGTIETEAYELNPYGRQVELEDFCTYKDGSMTSFNFILLYIYKKSPNIRKELEKNRSDRKKLLKDTR